jgi:hypothetical protein
MTDAQAPVAANRFHDQAEDGRPFDDEAAKLDELRTVDDVAAILRVSRNWVYEQTRRRVRHADQLRHVKIGKYVRFEAGAVREFIRRQSRRA